MEKEALSSYDRHEVRKQLGRKEDLCTPWESRRVAVSVKL